MTDLSPCGSTLSVEVEPSHDEGCDELPKENKDDDDDVPKDVLFRVQTGVGGSSIVRVNPHTP